MCTKDINTGERWSFIDLQKGNENAKALGNHLSNYDRIVMHNGIYYDDVQLRRLLGIEIEQSKVVDTLVLSQLLNAKRPDGHSLEAWGKFLGYPKVEHEDWTQFSPEMLNRCTEDVELTSRVFDFEMQVVTRNKDAFTKAIEIEHHSRFVARDMHENGFKFNYNDAMSMRKELQDRLDVLDKLMEETFPPKVEYIVLKTKTKEVTTKFNPGSARQIIERMWEVGWQPTSKTKGHIDALKDKTTPKERLEHYKKFGWKVDEENLATLPEGAPDACSYLVERIMTASRVRTLDEWMACYNPASGRVHGTFNPLGTATHRCSHNDPNMGNVATKKSIKYNTPKLRDLALKYGGRMRSMWICEEGSYLVGCDMESAHLRIFAHLINDEKFIKALISGRKEDGTDPHSLNKRALGDVCIDRDRAKTFIFSFLNGAGASKVADIFGCGKREAGKSLSQYVDSYPGLKYLKEKVIPSDAAKGYFKGVDGRLVINDSEHLMMGMYLQNMEATLMKYSMKLMMERLSEYTYKFINWVHDEVVIEVEGSKEDAETVGKICAQCIADVGSMFNLRCPMGGESKVGKNWLEVH